MSRIERTNKIHAIITAISNIQCDGEGIYKADPAWWW